MTFEAFTASLSGEQPDGKLSASLRALWWAAKGDWEAAHRLVQDESANDAAWVHAYLHRVEGDLGNARYWYAQAGRPASSDDLAAEWEAISRTLLRSL